MAEKSLGGALFHIVCLAIIFSLSACAKQSAQEVLIERLDQSQQPALFFSPEKSSAVPLLVALHTWSDTYQQKIYEPLERWCVENDWAFIQPNFRGPNIRPEGTGSEFVVQDILAAVEYVKRTRSIDSSSVYIVGSSGGGHAALLMAGRFPDKWAGVSAWVPIYDLALWHRQLGAQHEYGQNIRNSCGGDPNADELAAKECKVRSPSHYLTNLHSLPIQISAGIRDGHEGSVPINHSLMAFNALAQANDQLRQEDINYMTRLAQVPGHMESVTGKHNYGEAQPLFQRTSGNVSLTLFEGGHEFIPKAAIAWIENQYATRR